MWQASINIFAAQQAARALKQIYPREVGIWVCIEKGPNKRMPTNGLRLDYLQPWRPGQRLFRGCRAFRGRQALFRLP